MLTRLHVKGFKNLLDLDVRFGPFTCVAGSNGVGKSNLFDAIRFLNLLTRFPILGTPPESNTEEAGQAGPPTGIALPPNRVLGAPTATFGNRNGAAVVVEATSAWGGGCEDAPEAHLGDEAQGPWY